MLRLCICSLKRRPSVTWPDQSNWHSHYLFPTAAPLLLQSLYITFYRPCPCLPHFPDADWMRFLPAHKNLVITDHTRCWRKTPHRITALHMPKALQWPSSGLSEGQRVICLRSIKCSSPSLSPVSPSREPQPLPTAYLSLSSASVKHLW